MATVQEGCTLRIQLLFSALEEVKRVEVPSCSGRIQTLEAEQDTLLNEVDFFSTILQEHASTLSHKIDALEKKIVENQDVTAQLVSRLEELKSEKVTSSTFQGKLSKSRYSAGYCFRVGDLPSRW
ncbi:hypothetical protein FRC03_004799 [Tulasnella sp. 419]|nr:hypothetical protein FRC03_004799 [Tulasnella sp. 419]